MTKRVPGRIFQDFMSSFGTISDHISQLFQASFSGPQKWKKFKWPWLPAEATPDTSQVRGEPGSTQEAPRRHQEAPRKHPGGTQEAPRRHQGTQEAAGGLGCIK